MTDTHPESSRIASRIKQLAGYGLVGLTGIPIDMAVVWLIGLLDVHYALVTTAGYLAAMTWNFTLHRQLVFTTTNGLLRDYARYVAVDATAYAVRLLVVALLMSILTSWHTLATTAGVPPVVLASLAGIAAGFLAGFAGTIRYVFGGDDT